LAALGEQQSLFDGGDNYATMQLCNKTVATLQTISWFFNNKWQKVGVWATRAPLTRASRRKRSPKRASFKTILLF
jgi:hypothetical protein